MIFVWSIRKYLGNIICHEVFALFGTLYFELFDTKESVRTRERGFYDIRTRIQRNGGRFDICLFFFFALNFFESVPRWKTTSWLARRQKPQRMCAAIRGAIKMDLKKNSLCISWTNACGKRLLNTSRYGP